MTREEYLKHLISELAKAEGRSEVREVIKKADETLDKASFSKEAKAAFLHELVQEAQDNSATMANSGDAQKIVDQILNE